jgi:hypothetical protein
MLFYCRQNKITQHQKRVTIFVLFSFSLCFSSVNIFKVKLVVGFCHLGYGIFAILFLGIWDMCPLNYWDMGYCIVILGIFRDIFGF